MKRLLVLLPALALISCENGAGKAASGRPGWLTDYDAAVKESQASKKPILVDFGAEW
jgi:hypothetical protein